MLLNSLVLFFHFFIQFHRNNSLLFLTFSFLFLVLSISLSSFFMLFLMLSNSFSPFSIFAGNETVIFMALWGYQKNSTPPKIFSRNLIIGANSIKLFAPQWRRVPYVWTIGNKINTLIPYGLVS